MKITHDFEAWRPVDGFRGSYEVSNLGRVRSLDRVVRYAHPGTGTLVRCSRPGVLLRPGLTSAGYQSVSLCGRTQLVHRLVAKAFTGAIPRGMEVCHRDGIRTNNHSRNLYYGTRRQNNLDKRKHGTASRYKISPVARNRIRELYGSAGVTQAQLARMFGVHRNTIYNIVRFRLTSEQNA